MDIQNNWAAIWQARKEIDRGRNRKRKEQLRRFRERLGPEPWVEKFGAVITVGFIAWLGWLGIILIGLILDRG